MERCPNCRARTDGAAQCRRCGMELASLMRIEQAAEQYLRSALAALAAGQLSAASAALQHAQVLKTQPLASQLLGFIRVLDDGAKVDSAPGVITPAPLAIPQVTQPTSPQMAAPAAEAQWPQC